MCRYFAEFLEKTSPHATTPDIHRATKTSRYFGSRKIHSTHGVHPEAPNRHIFRLSNDPRRGIRGVGPQWHNDGSFVSYPFVQWTVSIGSRNTTSSGQSHYMSEIHLVQLLNAAQTMSPPRGLCCINLLRETKVVLEANLKNI